MMSTARLIKKQLQSYSANWMWRWWEVEQVKRSVVRRESLGEQSWGWIDWFSIPARLPSAEYYPNLLRGAHIKWKKGMGTGEEEREREREGYLFTYLLLYATPCISTTPALITRTGMKSKQQAASDCTPAAAGKAICICMTSSYSLSQSPLPHSASKNLAWIYACMLMYCCR